MVNKLKYVNMFYIYFTDIAAGKPALHGPMIRSDPYPASNAVSGDERCQDSGFTRVAKRKNQFWQVRLQGTCTVNMVTVGAKGKTSKY